MNSQDERSNIIKPATKHRTYKFECRTEAINKIILSVKRNPKRLKHMIKRFDPQCKVIEAHSDHDCLRITKESVPDLIISDVPAMDTDGYSFCLVPSEEINPSHIPVIILNSMGKLNCEPPLRDSEHPGDSPCHDVSVLLDQIHRLITSKQRNKHFGNTVLQLQEDISCPTPDSAFLIKTKRVIMDHMTDPEFNVNTLSQKLHVSRATLFRKIKTLTGASPNRLIRCLRLIHAAELLRANHDNITTIAFKVGFSSSSYFTKCFKKEFNLSPSEFINSHGRQACF